MIIAIFGVDSRVCNYTKQQANEIIHLPYFNKLIKAKKFQRKKDERNKPLADYQKEELYKMRRIFLPMI